MAHVTLYIPSLKTGAALKYPIIMKAPFDYTEFIQQYSVKDASEIAIGDIFQLTKQTLTIDTVGAKAINVYGIVLDTAHNKAILEANGSTVNKASQFASGDKVDVMPLLSGMVLSMKLIAAQDLQVGSKIVASATAGAVQLYSDTPAAILGVSVSDVKTGTGTDYVGVLVK